MTMSREGTNFSYFIGAVGLASTILTLTLLSRSYLPNTLIKDLDEVLKETRDIYEKSAAEELLPGALKHQYLERLSFLEKLQEELREQAYRTLGILYQYKALIFGLSIQILRVYRVADDLRSQVLTTSAKQQRSRDSCTPGHVLLHQVTLPLTGHGLEGLEHTVSSRMLSRNWEGWEESEASSRRQRRRLGRYFRFIFGNISGDVEANGDIAFDNAPPETGSRTSSMAAPFRWAFTKFCARSQWYSDSWDEQTNAKCAPSFPMPTLDNSSLECGDTIRDPGDILVNTLAEPTPVYLGNK